MKQEVKTKGAKGGEGRGGRENKGDEEKRKGGVKREEGGAEGEEEEGGMSLPLRGSHAGYIANLMQAVPWGLLTDGTTV